MTVEYDVMVFGVWQRAVAAREVANDELHYELANGYRSIVRRGEWRPVEVTLLETPVVPAVEKLTRSRRRGR